MRRFMLTSRQHERRTIPHVVLAHRKEAEATVEVAEAQATVLEAAEARLEALVPLCLVI